MRILSASRWAFLCSLGALGLACSSTSDDGDSDATGGAGGDASGSGGSSSSGGSAASDGGAGSGGTTEPGIICEVLPEGSAAEPRCEPLPAACGVAGDYTGARYGSVGPDSIHESSLTPQEVYLGLAGDDNLAAYGNGACLVGGEGDDSLEFGNDPVSPRANVGIGGPGRDSWFLDSPDIPAVLADVTVDEEIRAGAFGSSSGTYSEVIASFAGTSAAIGSADVRIVYDPTNGKIWLDEDGNGTSEAPVWIGSVANYEEVTLTAANFVHD